MEISELFRIITFYKFFENFSDFFILEHFSEKIYIFSRILHVHEF